MSDCRIDNELNDHDIRSTLTEVDEHLDDIKKSHMLCHLYELAIDEECEQSISALIEPIGNDDKATTELIKLMYVCGDDQDLLNNPIVAHQLRKFIDAMDTYTKESNQ